MKIIIEVAEVLRISFLQYIQEWLRSEARLWRVAIPTDNTAENLILIYPEVIKINEAAEQNIPYFLEVIRPRLAQIILEGRRQFNLQERPHPPIPD